MTITVSQLMTWISQAVQFALVIIFAVTLLQEFGFRIPMVPTMAAINLLYLCGAWALLNGRVKIG